MRTVQMAVWVAGVAAFGIAAVFAGSAPGDTWWRVGVAIMLSNLVLILLTRPPAAA